MDIAYIVISTILNELQSQFPDFTFYVEETANTSHYAPGIVTYTHVRWYQEYRNWLYYYLHEDAYIGISTVRSHSSYDTYYAYNHYSLLTPESLEQLTTYLRAQLKAL